MAVVAFFMVVVARSPIADKELSQADIIEKAKVEVVDLRATYLRGVEGRRVVILDGAETCGAEEYAARHFRRLGFDVLPLESRPFHVLFSVLMWMVIQDPTDPRVRVVAFGDRIAFEQGQPGKMVWSSLPDDFGTPGYGRKRASAIRKHMSTIPADNTELDWIFDLWLKPSEKLRQYLWAHNDQPVEAAERLIKMIPASILKTLLRYLVRNYWGRYLGWPDLLVHRRNEWFLAEVKASGDSLSEDQKRWINDNRRYLHLPFKLVKIHKQQVIETANA